MTLKASTIFTRPDSKWDLSHHSLLLTISLLRTGYAIFTHSFSSFILPSICVCITQYSCESIRKGGKKDNPYLSGAFLLVFSSNDLDITIDIFPWKVEVQGLSGARKLDQHFRHPWRRDWKPRNESYP